MSHPVLLFDGVCNLCNSSVQLIIRNDKKGKFRFASIQSDYGQEAIKKYDLGDENLKTVILIVGDKAYKKSSAALEVAKRMDGLWPCYTYSGSYPTLFVIWFIIGLQIIVTNGLEKRTNA